MEDIDDLALATPRLIVRRFRPDDWQDVFDYLSQPEIYRFEPGEPISTGEARQLAEARSKDARFLALELRDERKVIGNLSFLPVEPAELLCRELGFIVSSRYQGHGYAAEGGRALVEQAFASLGVHRVVAECHPDNVASWRTLEKIGFVREGVLRQNVFWRRDAEGRPCWQDTCVYALVNPEG